MVFFSMQFFRLVMTANKIKAPAFPGPFSVVCPVGHTYLEVKVLYGPDSGNR